MKKLMFLIMALLVAPAMATVTVEIVDNGDLTADIVISATDPDADAFGSLLAGIAFDASVDGGAIIEEVVPGSFHTGESTEADPGYGIYLGTITFAVVDDETVIDDAGSPVAPGDDPDAPPQLPGPECTLEFAALYNVNTPEAAPDAAGTTLCTIRVDQGTTLTLVLDDTRGQAALIGGGDPSDVVFVGGAIEAAGPACWTAPCQPFGDANGDGLISALDVQALLNAWGGAYDPCVDFNRDDLVSALDVQVLIGSWGNPCP